MSHLFVWVFINAIGVACWSLSEQSTAGELWAALVMSGLCMQFHSAQNKLKRTTHESEGKQT